MMNAKIVDEQIFNEAFIIFYACLMPTWRAPPPHPDPAPVHRLGPNIIPVEQLYLLRSIKFGKTWKFKFKFSYEYAP